MMNGKTGIVIHHSSFCIHHSSLIMDDTALERLQTRLGVRLKNIASLERAVTHRSAATENSEESNERLEFLGDSVVGLVISENLFRLFPHYSEGDLEKSKAYVVSETALAE